MVNYVEVMFYLALIPGFIELLNFKDLLDFVSQTGQGTMY